MKEKLESLTQTKAVLDSKLKDLEEGRLSLLKRLEEMGYKDMETAQKWLEGHESLIKEQLQDLTPKIDSTLERAKQLGF